MRTAFLLGGLYLLLLHDALLAQSIKPCISTRPNIYQLVKQPYFCLNKRWGRKGEIFVSISLGSRLLPITSINVETVIVYLIRWGAPLVSLSIKSLIP